jgi:hypothetical protein
MKFILTWSLLQGISSQEISKYQKIKWVEATLPKPSLVILGTFGPSGINDSVNYALIITIILKTVFLKPKDKDKIEMIKPQQGPNETSFAITSDACIDFLFVWKICRNKECQMSSANIGKCL